MTLFMGSMAHQFSVELTSAYHQIELDKQSRYITTFAIHVGLQRYTRSNYGTNSKAQIFDNLIRHLIGNISGTLNVADDIIIYCKDLSSHDKVLKLLLDRLSEKGLTANPKKCVLYQCSVEFFGHVFSNEGISASSNKVRAVRDASSPTNVTEVRSFLGLIIALGLYPNMLG